MNKFYPVILGCLLGCGGAGAAPASGFDLSFDKPAAPNTVAGVLANARDNDYVLLRGSFTEEISPEILLFADEHGSAVRVIFPEGGRPADLELNYEYFLWSQLGRADGRKILKALIISPHV